MSVLGVAFIPAAPLLVPDLVGMDTARDDDLRDGVRHAVRSLVGDGGEVPLLVVAATPETATFAGTWDFSRLGLPLRGEGPGSLPTPLGIAAWYLDDIAHSGPREYAGVSERTPPSACAALGQSLTTGRDVLILAVGDGSARRDERAPGHLDPRAVGWDEQAAQALASGDPEAVLALNADVARELLAVGRAPWQVAAGAARAETWRAALELEDARYGVEYLIARWTRP